MPKIAIVPATADRFDDAEHALTGGGDGRSCQCQWWTITNAEFQRATTDERRTLLRDELKNDAVPPALLAYVDGEAAAWVRVGPRRRRSASRARATSRRHSRSRWTTSRCMGGHVLRRPPRAPRSGSQHAPAGGGDRLRARPRRPGSRGVSVRHVVATNASNELYRGILSVFQAAGFREVARPKPDRAIVELDLVSDR